MEPDIKDVIGVLMRILGGGDVSIEELDDLALTPTESCKPS
jgi:hypothetical protein